MILIFIVIFIPFFFEEMQVNRVESRHDLNNPASGKVMGKCGLIKEGVKRQGDKNNTGICDVVFYGLVRDEWRACFFQYQHGKCRI